MFFLMYLHALHKKEELQLTPAEQFDTKTKMFAHVALLMVGLLSVIVSQLLPTLLAGSAGMIYFLIGPAVTVLHTLRGRKRRKLYGHS